MRDRATTLAEASERLLAHIRSLGTATPWLGVGRTFVNEGGAPVPAIVAFVSEREKAVVGPLEEFEGHPLVWSVARAA